MIKHSNFRINCLKIRFAKSIAVNSRRVKVVSTKLDEVVFRVVMPDGTTDSVTVSLSDPSNHQGQRLESAQPRAIDLI